MPTNQTKADKLFEAYTNGMPGWLFDQDSWDAVCESIVKDFGASAPLLAGTGKGKRALLWRYREKYDPGAYADEAQDGPDCVSHGDRNARDTTRCVEVAIKNEPEEYVARGATEPTYGARGHGGGGMDPARAARFVHDYGFLIRKNYGSVDLSKYNISIGDRWGSRGVPQDVLTLCREHPVRLTTRPTTLTEAMDLLFNGYAGHTGQNLGFARESDARGISVPSGKWNHDMGTVGYDDTREVYQVGVYFVQNSWGAWNRPPKIWPVDLYGPWIPGMIVCAADVYERYMIGGGSAHFYGDIGGFPRRDLPDLGFSGRV